MNQTNFNTYLTQYELNYYKEYDYITEFMHLLLS